MPPPIDKCETCLYHQAGLERPGSKELDWGECHKKSPSSDPLEGGGVAHWPKVQVEFWCGDYLKR